MPDEPESPDAPEMPVAPGAPDAAGQWVWLARIRRPQGRKGEVFADILTDFPERFADRRQLWLLSEGQPPSPVQLNNHWLHKGGVVLHFAGVESISDAEKLSGMIVVIPREQRVALAGDEVYISDLVGCVVVDVARADAPVVVGEIEDVERNVGPVPILIVRGAAGEVLVPFAKDYLRRIDLEGRRVEMVLPEGLVDLNE
jgi:16S rRNA processing protein RimM